MSIWAIALNTFREAIRDKLLYVLVIFAVLLILVSRAIGWVSYGGELKIMTDLGLTSIWLFAGMVSIFIGTGLIFKEIDKRTLYTILSKPIERWEFVVGKYFGLLVTTLLNVTLLSLVLIGYLHLMGAPLTGAIFQALSLTFIEMMVVTALAIFFSSVSTPVLSAIFTCIIFGAGQMTKWMVEMGKVAQESSPVMEKLLHGLYLFMPNLHNFNVRQEAVHASSKGVGIAIPWEDMFSRTAYGLSYVAVLILMAILLFRRRNF